MSCTATPPADSDGSTVYAACHPACATISTPLTGGGGSAFIMSHPTTALHGDTHYLLTAAHLFETPALSVRGSTSGSISHSFILVVTGANGATVPHTLTFSYVGNGTTAPTAQNLTLTNLVVTDLITAGEVTGFGFAPSNNSPSVSATFSWTLVNMELASNDTVLRNTAQQANTDAASTAALTIELAPQTDTAFLQIEFDYEITNADDHETLTMFYSDRHSDNGFTFAHISDWNHTGVDVVRPIQLIGVDGRGDVAVARILNSDFTFADMSEHVTVSFAESDAVSIGDRVYCIGDPLLIDFASISEGIVRDTKYADPGGGIIDALLVDCLTMPGNSGSMIVTSSNQVAGMVTFGFVGHDGLGGGPAVSLLREAFTNLVAQHNAELTALAAAGNSITSPISLGGVLRFPKAYLGLTLVPLLFVTDTPYALVFSSIRDNVRGWIVQHIEALPAHSQSLLRTESSLDLAVGDVVSALTWYDGQGWNEVVLGVTATQHTPASVLWLAERYAQYVPLTGRYEFSVHITYRKQSENYATEHTALNVLLYVRGDTVSAFPEELDASRPGSGAASGTGSAIADSDALVPCRPARDTPRKLSTAQYNHLMAMRRGT